ncbi:MAG: metallophosphoesterase [Oscillospiraceae bacterium]|nr:metallophosphoesterase [Oscillospiraceae bacterium]
MKFMISFFSPKKLCLAAFILLAAFVLVWFTSRSYTDPVVREVSMESDKISDPVRFVFIADLHENVFGENNRPFYDQLKALDPDFILIGGDIINWTSEKDAYAVEVITELAGFADVYFSIGNHEIEYLRLRREIEFNGLNRNNSSLTLVNTDENGFIRKIERAGATVLQKSWVDIEINGTKLRIGGAYEEMRSLDPDNPKDTMLPGMYAFLSGFQDTDSLKLYMTHRPYSFLGKSGPSSWDIDVVLCGHEHGGQVVLPGLGGLYSRERGLFPKYTHGVFGFGGTTLIVTSGVGSDAEPLPRFNNRPEIVLVTIT